MKTTRRSFFIKSAGATSIAYQLAGAAPAMKPAGPNDQLGVGFIGIGIRGSYHLDNFKQMPGVRALIAADCYDGHLDYAKEATEGAITTTKDYFDVLNRKDIDAVVIATPDHWHSRMVLDALAAGKHVYIEKPLTYTIAEGKAICEAAKKSGKMVTVGSQNKTSTLTAKAREIVKSGALGKINMVRLATYRNSPDGAWVYPIPADASSKTIDWNRWLGPAPKREFDPKRVFRWRCWWDYSGGVATDLWVHTFTTLHEILDVTGPTSAVAQGGIFRFDDGRTCPDLLTGVFEYPSFILENTCNLGNASRASEGIVIMGSEATMVVNDRNLNLTFESPASPVGWYGLNGWTRKAKGQYLESLGLKPDAKPERSSPKPAEVVKVQPGLEHWELFVKAIREGGQNPETPEEGHNAAAAAHLGNMAYRKKRRIAWDSKTNKVTES
jgi:predicted dehydrogenase